MGNDMVMKDEGSNERKCLASPVLESTKPLPQDDPSPARHVHRGTPAGSNRDSDEDSSAESSTTHSEAPKYTSNQLRQTSNPCASQETGQAFQRLLLAKQGKIQKDSKNVHKRPPHLTTTSDECHVMPVHTVPPMTLVSVKKPQIGRLSHTLVERRYREHLNQQIDSLRSLLPKDAAACSSPTEDPLTSKPISKAAAIAAAVSYIQELEAERAKLEVKAETLEACIAALRNHLPGGNEFHLEDRKPRRLEPQVASVLV